MEAIRFRIQKSLFCLDSSIASTEKILLFQLSNGIKNVDILAEKLFFSVFVAEYNHFTRIFCFEEVFPVNYFSTLRST